MKTCFIIMPIADMPDYPSGHFSRVYDHIIKPACNEAGFHPFRADEAFHTNYIAIDIVKRIIESDMALCDLSGRNPNVLYELGIRQAFNRPVALMKDKATDRVFDIQGFRDVPYDESMRIDTVQAVIAELSRTLKNTYDNHATEVNSLVSLLGINPAELKSVQITQDTDLILQAIKSLGDRIGEVESLTEARVNALSTISTSKSSSMTLLDPLIIKKGDQVYHQKFGHGTVRTVEGGTNNRILGIDFKIDGHKKVMANYARLYGISPLDGTITIPVTAAN